MGDVCASAIPGIRQLHLDGHREWRPRNDYSSGHGHAAAASSGGGLTTGAKAGIGVGAALGALLLLAVVIGVLLLRRRSHPRDQPQSGYPTGMAMDPKMQPGQQENAISHELDNTYERYEMDASKKYEMDAIRARGT